MRISVPVLSTLIAATPIAAADIVHVQFADPFRVHPTDGSRGLDLDADGIDDIVVTSTDIFTTIRALNGGIFSPTFLGPFVKTFAPGELIDPVDFRFKVNIDLWLDCPGDPDEPDWSDTGAYLGLRLGAGPDFHAGWLLVSSALPEITIYAYAYETTPNMPIRAGAIPAPGSLGALALGALALNRRFARLHPGEHP